MPSRARADGLAALRDENVRTLERWHRTHDEALAGGDERWLACLKADEKVRPKLFADLAAGLGQIGPKTSSATPVITLPPGMSFTPVDDPQPGGPPAVSRLQEIGKTAEGAARDWRDGVWVLVPDPDAPPLVAQASSEPIPLDTVPRYREVFLTPQDLRRAAAEKLGLGSDRIPVEKTFV